MSIAALYLTFLKFGLLCFGGGYMLIPLITAELVGVPPRPLTPESFAALSSIAQITPGPIGINTATYVGFMEGGVAGGILASLGMVTCPSVLMLLALHTLKRFKEHFLVRSFLKGMRPAACGFVLAATFIFAGLSLFDRIIPHFHPGMLLQGKVKVNFYFLLIAALVYLALKKTRISFLWLLIASGAAGALYAFF